MRNPFKKGEKVPESNTGKEGISITNTQSSALVNDLNEDTDAETKESITKIKDSGKEFFIVYRSNTLYDELVPSMKKTLTNHKIPFSCKTFPQGTDKMEIKQWVEEHRHEFIGKIFVSDDTCDYEYDYKNNERNAFHRSNLDYICNESVKTYYEKNFDTELEFGKNNFDTMFINLLKQCLTCEQPEKIIIVKPAIFDHGTAQALECNSKENMRNLYDTNRTRYNEITNQVQSAVAQKIQEFVKSTGYRGEIIISDGDDNHKMDSDKNRFIYDRHMNDTKKPRVGKSLILPFSNLLEQMQKYGFLQDIPSIKYIKKHILQNIVSGIE